MYTNAISPYTCILTPYLHIHVHILTPYIHIHVHILTPYLLIHVHILTPYLHIHVHNYTNTISPYTCTYTNTISPYTCTYTNTISPYTSTNAISPYLLFRFPIYFSSHVQTRGILCINLFSKLKAKCCVFLLPHDNMSSASYTTAGESC